MLQFNCTTGLRQCAGVVQAPGGRRKRLPSKKGKSLFRLTLLFTVIPFNFVPPRQSTMSDSRSDDSATAQPPNKRARSDIVCSYHSPPLRRSYRITTSLQTDGWQPIPTRYSQLMSFHQTWWGKHAAVLEQSNAIVTVADSLPTQVALNMRQSKGMMLVREEYLRLYTQLCELHEAMYTGVAIIGQPGIGAFLYSG